MIEVASRDDFVLFEREDNAAPPWRSFKLVKAGHAPKRNWWLGWNGEHLARNRDAALLAEFHPEIESWIVSTLGKSSPSSVSSVS
jgi:hypothetical protein